MNFLKKGLLAGLTLMGVASAQAQVVPTPSVKNLAVCEKSIKLDGSLTASINPTVSRPASDFELVWYVTKPDGTIDESLEYKEIELSPTIQKASESRETVYKYYVRQRLISNPNAMSTAVPVTVTVYKTPKIKKLVTAPKCYGETQNLLEMFEVDVIDCEAEYYFKDQDTQVSGVVSESGTYAVRCFYTINSFLNEEICVSNLEYLSVAFHSIDADIVGSNATCPGVGVDLEASVEVGGGLKESDVVYSWSNNLNANVGNAQTYNTGSEGLENAGDLMKVNLEVSSAACKGIMATNISWTINVGNGPLVGNIKFSEADNKEIVSEPISTKDITFHSCGGKVEVELSDVVSTDGGSYILRYLNDDIERIGTFSNETAGTTTLKLGAGKYSVEYVNNCPTKFDFEIIDHSVKANSRNSKLTICEGEIWSAEIIDISGPTSLSVEWKKDGEFIPGENGTKLVFKSAKPSDSGAYSYSLSSAGCVYEGNIALGEKLTVKPYVSFVGDSYLSYYEVTRGESQEINLEFTTPVDVSEIESDVKWYDESKEILATGATYVIEDVQKDCHLHVVAENEDYCKGEINFEILVDAALKMTASLEKDQIKAGESTILTVDTTGTGRVLHSTRLIFDVTEKTAEETNSLSLIAKDGKLMAEVSPTSDAIYEITYKYGDQDASMILAIKVTESDDVRNVVADPNGLVNVVDINGILVKKQVEYKNALNGLPSGVYMVGGVKTIVK